MNATTGHTAPTSSAARPGFRARYASHGWMQLRNAANIFRVCLGVLILASLPLAGPLALLGIIPLVWAAVSFRYDYRLRHNTHSAPPSPAGR